jgi:TRAP-type C4-dicarboxylate transport system permease small subunit
MNRWLAEICGWLLSVMIIFLCFDIFSRVAKQPVQGAAELAVFVMIAAIYLGLAQCEQMDKHIKVTALLDRMPVNVQKVLRIINASIQIVVVMILIWAAYKNLIYTYTKNVALSGTVPLSLWPIRLVVLLGLFFYGLQSLLNLIQWLKDFFPKISSNKV